MLFFLWYDLYGGDSMADISFNHGGIQQGNVTKNGCAQTNVIKEFQGSDIKPIDYTANKNDEMDFSAFLDDAKDILNNSIKTASKSQEEKKKEHPFKEENKKAIRRDLEKRIKIHKQYRRIRPSIEPLGGGHQETDSFLECEKEWGYERIVVKIPDNIDSTKSYTMVSSTNPEVHDISYINGHLSEYFKGNHHIICNDFGQPFQEYDENGILVKQYYYDDDLNINKVEMFDEYGNSYENTDITPPIDILFEYKYDETGKCIEKHLYDEKGIEYIITADVIVDLYSDIDSSDIVGDLQDYSNDEIILLIHSKQSNNYDEIQF